jgi:hypothetical protein
LLPLSDTSSNSSTHQDDFLAFSRESLFPLHACPSNAPSHISAFPVHINKFVTSLHNVFKWIKHY